MINGRRIITTIVCGLVFAATVNADMLPVCGLDIRQGQSTPVRNHEDLVTLNLSSPSSFTGIDGLDSLPISFLTEINTNLEQTSEIQQPLILTDGTNSLSLYLSALLGLGLCSSVHFMKRLSFSFVPEWYHSGGPFQVGHSYAATPESLCAVPAFCFIQPACMADDSLQQYHWGAVISLWRKSQFTPSIIASRGPPHMS